MTSRNGDCIEFPHGLDIASYTLPAPRTLSELAMVIVSATIRSKPLWWDKYKDPEVRSKWRAEAVGRKFVWIEAITMLVDFGHHERYTEGFRWDVTLDDLTVALTEKQADYVLDELEGYAMLRDDTSGIEVSCFDGIWQSDRLIPSSLNRNLMDGIQVLEDVPKKKKNWRPRSNHQILDLVHPSFYPLVIGSTLARYPDTSGPLEPFGSPDDIDFTAPPQIRSNMFQWIPTDLSVDESGEVRALGYINNLHPSNQGLYRCIEGVIKAFLPLWERVLSDMLRPIPTRIIDSYLPLESTDPDCPRRKQFETYDEYDNALDDHYLGVWDEKKVIGLPDVPEGGYHGCGIEDRVANVMLRGRTLQVFVKLTNIHLTPDNPSFEGGWWHIEGMVNERIIASGVYCYDQENITTGRLAFRIAVDNPKHAPRAPGSSHYDFYAHIRTWGMYYDYDDYENSTKLNNVIGGVEILKDRCLAYPNTYQHRVTSFRLEDPTKPGYRKILALFLVDPTIAPIPSTTHIAPQQASWLMEVLATANKLPAELLTMIENDTSLTNDRKAKELSHTVMKEREMILDEAEEEDEEFLFARIYDWSDFLYRDGPDDEQRPFSYYQTYLEGYEHDISE